MDAALKRCCRPLRTDDGVLPTMLYPRRDDVRRENLHHFDTLPDAERTYTAVDRTPDAGGESWFGTLDRDLQAYRHLRLKKGAQVMLLANINLKRGLCNGSRGVVVGFTEVGDYASAVSPEERAQSERSHLERLKATLARDGSGGGGGGRGDSGGRTLSDEELFFAAMDPDSRRFLEATEAAGLGLPIVRFANGATLTVKMHTWKKTKANGTVELSRTQLPLALAWALTVHKCQGMSLDRVRMDISHVFSEGQAYVALSRARSLEGMEIMGYKLTAIRASDRVRQFYATAGSAFGVKDEGGKRRGNSGDGDGDEGGDGGECGEGGCSANNKRRRTVGDDEEEEGITAGSAAAATAAGGGGGGGFLQSGDAEVAADALAQAARSAAAAAVRAGVADPAAAARDELVRMATAAVDAGLKAWRDNTRR